MANAATITFGFDGVEVEQGLNRLSQSTKKLTNDVQSAGGKLAAAGGALDKAGGSSALTRRLGGASQQIQDIAVQLQGGTSALTVFTQQGSQLAGAFGPAGAIFGGVVAVGGALLSMGAASNEAFGEMAQEVDAAATAAKKLSGSAGLGSVLSTLQQVQAAQKTVIAQQEKANSLTGMLGDFGGNIIASFTGGPYSDEKEVERELARDRLKAAEERLNKEAQLEAKAQTEMAKLRRDADKGDAVAADRLAGLERQRALEQEIAQIKDSALQAATKEELIRQATARSLLADPRANQAAAAKTAAAKNDKLIAAQRNLGEQLDIKELRARGKDKQADELQRGLQLRDRTAEIVRQTGATPQAAAAFAQREQDAEQALQRRSSGDRKIRGGISSKTFEGLAGRKFPGLDNLAALQERSTVDGAPVGGRVIPIGKAFARQNASNARAQQQRENKMVPEAGQMLSTLQAIEKHLSNVN